MSRFLLALVLTGCCFGAAATRPADPLGRENPRSAVTGFLAACHDHDYTKASQYLDLSAIPDRLRAQEAPKLAQQLESLLNADRQFDPLLVTQEADQPTGSRETVATIKRGNKAFPLQLQSEAQTSGPALWLFAPDTVTLVPKLAPIPSTQSEISARLPRFLVDIQFAGTPLWIWIALVIAALVIAGVVRMLTALCFRALPGARWHGVHAWFEPALIVVATLAFRLGEEGLVPTAFARLEIAKFLLLVIVSAVAWALVNLIELFLTRLDAVLDPRQRVVSRSLIYLGRRTARVIVFVFAAIFILDNWGFPMTTIIAGLGVSGIAIALAAQQTIANVFGGVSVIGDHPIMVGDFGNFGGVTGFVDDIGLRSTRIRTLSRTVVSIPNSAFAGMNLENYSLRDKILFNPTLSVKRTAPDDLVRKLIDNLESMLKQQDHRLQLVPTPVRITAITTAAYSVEIFCYALTSDPDEFYRIATDLYVQINQALTVTGVELA